MSVRLALLLTFAVMGMTAIGARGDDGFVRVELDPAIGYIVPESYAEAHRTDLVANIPATVRIEGFWTPSQSSVEVAERVFREKIHAAAKDPSILFPGMAKRASSDSGEDANENLEQEQKELEAISTNFQNYARQYVGIIVRDEETLEKVRLVFCNYSSGTKVDPSAEYIYTDKTFELDGSVHFLQCRYDPEKKECSAVSLIGPWLWVPKRDE